MSTTPRLVGVYQANGGLKGELAYVIGKLQGTTHCALCDITHGSNPFGKSSWKKAMACLPLRMDLVHLNEMDESTSKILSPQQAPAVVYLDGEKDHILIDAQELEQCNKDPQKLYDLLVEKLRILES